MGQRPHCLSVSCLHCLAVSSNLLHLQNKPCWCHLQKIIDTIAFHLSHKLSACSLGNIIQLFRSEGSFPNAWHSPVLSNSKQFCPDLVNAIPSLPSSVCIQIAVAALFTHIRNDLIEQLAAWMLTPTWFEHTTWWSGVRRATVAYSNTCWNQCSNRKTHTGTCAFFVFFFPPSSLP